MNMTVSDHLLQRLRQWGVRRVFGYPGDGINGLTCARELPGEAAIAAAAAVLNEGKRVAILAGAGALQASQELIEVAELHVGAPEFERRALECIGGAAFGLPEQGVAAAALELAA